MIGIIDYGVGNILSVANMVKKVGGIPIIIKNHNELNTLKPNKIILPGVGSFDASVLLLHDGGWVKELNKFIEQPKNKLLGICLGMQLMFEGSDEGSLSGLGWIKGKVKKFIFNGNKIKVPHMGWNIIHPRKNNKLFDLNNEEKRFYFVHSYYANCVDKNDVTATCNYGFDFTCAIEKNNIMGVQFHPEKSHRFGMALMKKFLELK
jgi:imidazole glycerol-phosphate synthase subunit HisH